MMTKMKLYISLFLLSIILVGCVETKSLETVSLNTLFGLDLSEDENSLSTTTVIRQVNPDLESTAEIISAENETIRGTSDKINLKTSKRVMSGQLRVVLFGEDLAKEGIEHYVDTFLRSSKISGSVLMAVVEGQAKTALEYPYKNIGDIGQHIFKLLEQNIKSEQTTSPTIHEISRDLYSPGRDNALPILKKEEEILEISGVALFKKDKMVGKLSAHDSFYVLLSRNVVNDGPFDLSIPKEKFSGIEIKNPPEMISIAFDTTKGKTEMKLIDRNAPEFDLNVEIKTRLLEVKADMEDGDPKVIKKLEKIFSDSIAEEFNKVIEYCQSVNSDVFGFGKIYRSSVRNSNLTHEKWHEMYPNAKINVHIKLTIIRSGVFD